MLNFHDQANLANLLPLKISQFMINACIHVCMMYVLRMYVCMHMHVHKYCDVCTTCACTVYRELFAKENIRRFRKSWFIREHFLVLFLINY